MTPYADTNRPCMIIRYVPHYRVEEYERVGWIRHDGLNGTHHGAYSCLMEWPLAKGEVVEPEQGGLLKGAGE